MHELALGQSLVDGVQERLPGAQIARVVLEVGELSGVVPDALRFCFDVCAEGTPLAGAALEIVAVAGHARCRSCARESDVATWLDDCACGRPDWELQRGGELRVREVEVR